MSTVIALYTATGNSLYAAKQIPDAEIHFVEEFLSGKYTLPDDTDRLGLVFPVYCWGLPHPIRRFISEYLANRDNSALGYIFAIATCGAFPLYTLHDLSQELAGVGFALSYGASVCLPDAYLPLKKKAVTEEETKKQAAEADKKLESIKDAVMREEILIPHRGPFWRVIRAFSRAGMSPRRNNKLSVSAKCAGCGICASICPEENIEIENGKAVYKDRCISCFACYHRCPENAIDYKGATGQYKGLVETKELKKR